MAPVQKLPSGNHFLLAETFRKWYGSTIFVTMEYAPLSPVQIFAVRRLIQIRARTAKIAPRASA